MQPHKVHDMVIVSVLMKMRATYSTF